MLLNKKLTINKFNMLILALLFSFINLVMLQNVSDWARSFFRIRDVLYLYLYSYLLISILYSRIVYFTKEQILIVIYFLYSICVLFTSVIRYDAFTAINGFRWQMSMFFLAPLSCFLIKDIKQVKVIVNIWLSVIVLGAISIVYQMLGGELLFLIDQKMRLRAGEIRYSSLLSGDPNYGAMAAVILFVFAILIIKKGSVKGVCIISSLIIVLSALSKAGIFGFFLSVFLMLLFSLFEPTKYHRTNITKAFKLVIIMFIITMIIIGISYSLIMYLKLEGYFYGLVSLLSYRPTGASLNIIEDLEYRIVGKVMDGIKLVDNKSDMFLRDLLFGSGYGIIRDEERRFSPHNGFLEITLIGGIINLGFLVMLFLFTFKQLFKLRTVDSYYNAFLISFCLIIMFMFTVPAHVQPILGSFLWLTVGLAANPLLRPGLYISSEPGLASINCKQ